MRSGQVSEFIDMMTSKVVVATPTTSAASLFGQPSFAGTSSTYAARMADVDNKMRSTPGFNGEVKTVAWIASTSTSAITMKSKITLSDGTSPPIIRVDYPRDQFGVHHTKVSFG